MDTKNEDKKRVLPGEYEVYMRAFAAMKSGSTSYISEAIDSLVSPPTDVPRGQIERFTLAITLAVDDATNNDSPLRSKSELEDGIDAMLR